MEGQEPRLGCSASARRLKEVKGISNRDDNSDENDNDSDDDTDYEYHDDDDNDNDTNTYSNYYTYF